MPDQNDAQGHSNDEPHYNTPPKANPWALSGAGVELAAAVAGLTLLGWWIDSRYSTKPWFTLIGAAMGTIGGIYNLWKHAKRYF